MCYFDKLELMESNKANLVREEVIENAENDEISNCVDHDVRE